MMHFQAVWSCPAAQPYKWHKKQTLQKYQYKLITSDVITGYVVMPSPTNDVMTYSQVIPYLQMTHKQTVKSDPTLAVMNTQAEKLMPYPTNVLKWSKYFPYNDAQADCEDLPSNTDDVLTSSLVLLFPTNDSLTYSVVIPYPTNDSLTDIVVIL